MIEGLKVTVPGPEMREICMERVLHHETRVKDYAAQIESMRANQITGFNYSGGDPVSNLTEKMNQHKSDASEMRFIADHIDTKENYLLDDNALRKLGITKGRY